MPRIVDLGPPYGRTSFADDATDDDVLNQYDALEAERGRALKEAKLVSEKLADDAEQQRPTLGKIATLAGLNLREGAAGSAKQAVGNVARTIGSFFAVPPEDLSKMSEVDQAQEGLRPMALLRDAGKSIAEEGSTQLRDAADLSERVGGGLTGKITSGLASTIGASAPALLAAPLGLTAAAVGAGLQSYGSNAESFKEILQSRNPKLSEEEAFKQAQIPAALTGAFTGVLTRGFGGVERFVDRVAKEGLRRQGVSALLRETFKSASLEIPEEAIDQLAQGFTEKAYVNPDKDVGEIFNDAALAGLTAFAAGGLTVGAISLPVKAAESIAGGIENRKLRRESDAASRERIQKIIREREAQDAAQSAGATGEVDIENKAPATTPIGGESNEKRRQEGRQEEGVLVAPAPVGQGSAPPVAAAFPTAQENLTVPPAAAGKSLQEVIANYQQISNAELEAYRGKNGGGGATGFAWDLGRAARTPEDVAMLRQMAEQETARGRELMKSGDLDALQAAMAVLGRQPAEAYEFATGVTLDGKPKWTTFEKRVPGYVPTVPDAQYLATKGQIDQSSASPTSDKIVAAAVRVGDQIFTGTSHADAASKAVESGALVQNGDIFTTPDGNRLPDGSYDWFQTQSGKLIPRNVAYKTYGSKAVDTIRQSPAAPSSPQIKAFSPVMPEMFMTQNAAGDNVIDIPKLREMVETGQLTGGPASNAILLHLLQNSDLHPINPIKLIDMGPQQLRELNMFTDRRRALSQGGAYKGLFYTYRGSRIGNLELLTRNDEGNPISQVEFVTLLIHEMVHNNVTSKLPVASPELKAQANDLFAYFMEQSQGTDWQSHNASLNVDEFFAEALSNPNLQRYLTGLDYTGRSNRAPSDLRNSAFGKFLDIIRMILRLPEFITTAFGKKIASITVLDQVVGVSSDLQDVRREASAPSQAAASPAESPKIEGLQVEGTSAEVGRIADEIYKQREAGNAQLEKLSYERRQYRMANSELKRLSDMAYGRFGGSTQTGEDVVVPDPSEGIVINDDNAIAVDDTFTGILSVMDVPHSAENVKAMQAEIFFEKSARRLNNIVANLDTLKSARQNLILLKADEKEIQKLSKQIGRIETKANKLRSVEHGDTTIGERAGEIVLAEQERPVHMAKRQALSLEPVAEFFGRQVGSYRDFIEKAAAGERMATALRDAATTPEEIARLEVELSKWISLPDDIRSAIRARTPLTEEQLSSAFASLSMIFEAFDGARQKMMEMQAAQTPGLNLRERELMKRISQLKIDSGTASVMMSDVMSTLGGETGETGSLQSQKISDSLRRRISAIKTFATRIGNDLDTNRELFEWLANPLYQREPALATGAFYGIDDVTFEMILDEVRRNPNFGSAIVALIEASDKKMADVSRVQLEKLEELVRVENMDAARALANRLRSRAKANASVAESEIRESLNELDQINIDRMALENGAAMFAELESEPDFMETRRNVSNSPYGLVEPMIAQNGIASTLKPFGNPGIPAHPGLVMGAQDNVVLKSEWFRKVAEWNAKAQEHIDAYDTAESRHLADPANNPPPAALGFDLPKVRGLRDAVSRFVSGSFLELSLLSEDKRWKIPWLVRKLNKTSWFRQHEFVSKMVGGVSGTDLRARLGDFVNHFLIARSVMQKYSDIPKLLHAALKSHPTIGMSMPEYRSMFNEMAHWGRMFPSPVRAGFRLPMSGVIVTSEDVALLRRERAYEDELRRRVTETNTVTGVRVKSRGRELVRAGAYVGEDGLPRHLNTKSSSFIADVVAAYGAPAGGFLPTTDLSSTSADPIVAFWNRNPKLLIQHVLDVKRRDKTMRLNNFMQRTHDAAATSWIATGTPVINSIEELVTHLVGFAPNMPGLNTRDLVVSGLNEELKQYRDAAKGIQNDRAEREQARNSGAEIALSADNEFTKPAALLELPSAMYDYGAVTPSEHLAIASRANHERVVAYATAVNRAEAEINNRIQRYRDREITEKEAAQSYGGDIEEMKEVAGILRKVADDFESAYRTNNPASAPNRFFNEAMGMITSAVLALPTVGIRNMTQGQFETFMMSRAMGMSGHTLSMGRALKQMAKTLSQFGLTLGAEVMKKTDLGATFITGRNVDVFEKLVDQVANLIGMPNYKSAGSRVHELGYDTREGFIERLRRIWEETAEISVLEQAKEKTVNVGGEKRRVGGLAGVPSKALRALFDKIGVQQYDQAINASMLTYTEWMQKRLEEVAMEYGASRARMGMTAFDPTDPRWQLKPDEWAAFKGEEQNADSLQFFKLVLEGSANSEGFQLEKNLWDFYTKTQAGQQASIFTPRQYDAFQRKMVAEFNASTPANRASASSGSNVIRNLLTLQGYVSDGLLKLLNTSIGGSRDRTNIAAFATKTPILLTLAFMSVLIGYAAGGLTGEWDKRVRGRAPALPTPLDADFWSSFKRWGEGTTRLGLAQMFYIGDVILAMRGEVQGNRGFDPVGRVFPISIAQRTLNTVRGMFKTATGAGSLTDSFAPAADFARSIVPYWLEVENAFGASQGGIKQGERIVRGEAQNQNLLPEARMQMLTGQAYGPTTIVRRNVTDSVSRMYEAQRTNDVAGVAANTATAKAELAKLEKFYTEKYIANGDDPEIAAAKAQRDVWNDYQELNPVVAAMMGKRPTKDQYDLIRKNITGERAAIVDRSIEAWQSGAMALFGREGSITREDIAGSRGGGMGSGGGVASVMRSPITSPIASAFKSVSAVASTGSRRRTSGLGLPSVRDALRSRAPVRGRVGLRRRTPNSLRRRSQPSIGSRRRRSSTTRNLRRRKTYA